MTAPAPMPDGAQPRSEQDGEQLKVDLRELLPKPVTGANEEALEKIASGVRSKIDAERAKKEADGTIFSGLKILDPDLFRTHNVCEAHRVIGKKLGRADGQPVRRIVKPPKKKTDAPVQAEPTEERRGSEDSVIAETEQPVRPAADANPPGRKVKWNDDRLDEDLYIKLTVEEAMEYLPVCNGEPHPKARILISQLTDRLGLTGADSPRP